MSRPKKKCVRQCDIADLFLKGSEPLSLEQLGEIFSNEFYYFPVLAKTVRAMLKNETLVESISYPDGIRLYSLSPMVKGFTDKGVLIVDDESL